MFERSGTEFLLSEVKWKREIEKLFIWKTLNLLSTQLSKLFVPYLSSPQYCAVTE